MYEEPINNSNCQIPESFLEFKNMANSAMYEVENFYDILLKIVSTSDPEVALAAYEEVRSTGYGVSVEHTFDDRYLEDAVDAYNGERALD